jgi:hypothetical protein
MLMQTNEMLQDMPFKEGNLNTGQRNTVRTGNPTVGFRRLNAGVAKSKSTYAQFDEGCGTLEGNSVTDVKLVQLGGNEAAIRMQEAKGFMEAMSQTAQTTFAYGDTGLNQATFTGFTPRYNSIGGTTGQNIIDAGGTGSDNTSIWLVQWDEDMCGIFPKGTKAGVQHTDMGKQVERDASNNEFIAYKDFWTWDCGLSVGDWRQAVRIANIDVSNLRANSSAADLIELMAQAIDRIPNSSKGKMFFYMNRTVKSILKVQGLRKSNSAVAVNDALSQFDSSFLGIPLRKVDAFTLAEARVV